jgi:hypothetical protein
MAVALMLEPLFAAYESLLLTPNEERVAKADDAINLNVTWHIENYVASTSRDAADLLVVQAGMRCR